MGHAAEMLEGAHVPVEKRHLILARIEPCEVAARVHQPHDKHPRPCAAHPRRRRAPQRNPPRRGRQACTRSGTNTSMRRRFHSATIFAHDAVSRRRDPPAIEHLVQPRRREPLALLPAVHSRRLTEELLHARPHALLGPGSPAAPARVRTAWLPRRTAERCATRHAQLARHPPDRELLDENLVPNYVDLIHPQHPPAEPPGHRPSQLSRLRGGSVSGRRLDQFHSAAISTFHDEFLVPGIGL